MCRKLPLPGLVSQTTAAAQLSNAAQRELSAPPNDREGGVSFRHDAARDATNRQNCLDTAKPIWNRKGCVKEARRAISRRWLSRAQTNVKTARKASVNSGFLRGQSSQRSKASSLLLNGVVADDRTAGEFAVSQLSSTPLMTIADMTTINIEVTLMKLKSPA
jgi:hypothetical protein